MPEDGSGRGVLTDNGLVVDHCWALKGPRHSKRS